MTMLSTHERRVQDPLGGGGLSQEDQDALALLKVPIPHCEHQRIRVLREARILDTPSEESYNRHAAFASRIFKVSISL